MKPPASVLLTIVALCVIAWVSKGTAAGRVAGVSAHDGWSVSNLFE